jgi:hypothetical protein
VVLQVRDSGGDEWRTICNRSRDDAADNAFQRFPLPAHPQGRYVRVSVDAAGVSYLDEVLAWGDAEASAAVPEAYRPVVPAPVASEIAFCSIPGIEKTAFSDARYVDWQRDIGAWRKQPVVWSRVSTWDSISHEPLPPAATGILRDVRLTTSRNATECAALALTSTTSLKATTLTVSVSAFHRVGNPAIVRGLKAELRAAGAIGSRHYGTNLGPLFAADNLLAGGLMQRYLTNGAGIKDFPRLTLSQAGSAVLWLSVTANSAKPGIYEARISCSPGPGLTLRVEVLDVTLPHPFVWLQTWSGTTSMFPFVYSDREEREVIYKQSLGASVWGGWPMKGTAAQIARAHGRAIYDIWGIGDYGHRLYANAIDPDKLTTEDEAKIADLIHGHVKQARELGLGYDDWYIELTDEPGQANSRAFGALARLVRKADPKVRICCNPSFWTGNGCAPDDTISRSLGPWYRETVDVSAPIYLLLRDRPKSAPLFNAARFVRAYYTVSTQSAKGERAPQLELYQRLAWDAFKRGWNGWGFYSYYAPRGNPWSDFDADWATGEDMPDYLMVYPGPRGPIPTRQSEAVRQGWQDYCLLTLLRKQGKKAELASILIAYERGMALDKLRARALRAAATR